MNMLFGDRVGLMAHLQDQARYLEELVSVAREDAENSERLLSVRDELFTIRETLDSLGVPKALMSNADWKRPECSGT